MTPRKAQRYFAFIFLMMTLTLWAVGLLSWLTWSAVQVTLLANVLLFGLTLFLFRRTYKSFSDPNPQVSIRAIISGFMIKFFVLTLAALLYIFLKRKALSLWGLGGAATLYVLYTIVEIRALLLLLKKGHHA